MFNRFLEKMQPSASMKSGFSEGAQQLNLALGSPDLAPPQEVSDLLTDAIRQSKYGYVPSKGTQNALSNTASILFGPNSNIDAKQELMLVNGAKYGIYLALKTICNAGDSIVIMEPYWLGYPEIAHSLGIGFSIWRPIINQQYELEYSFEELKKIVREQRPKLFLLNNPNNPSGSVFSARWLHELKEILLENGITLLLDEVYKNLTFDGQETKDYWREMNNIIRIGSFSKSLAIPGLRLGYVAANHELIACADLFNQNIQTCINSLANHLAENITAHTYFEFSRHCSETYYDRYLAVRDILAAKGLPSLSSHSTFYMMVDFSRYFESGEAACAYLKEQYGLLAVPGLPYGQAFQKYVRICLTHPKDILIKHITNLQLPAPHASV